MGGLAVLPSEAAKDTEEYNAGVVIGLTAGISCLGGGLVVLDFTDKYKRQNLVSALTKVTKKAMTPVITMGQAVKVWVQKSTDGRQVEVWNDRADVRLATFSLSAEDLLEGAQNPAVDSLRGSSTTLPDQVAAPPAAHLGPAKRAPVGAATLSTGTSSEISTSDIKTFNKAAYVILQLNCTRKSS